jgi:hypothetical protein
MHSVHIIPLEQLQPVADLNDYDELRRAVAGYMGQKWFWGADYIAITALKRGLAPEKQLVIFIKDRRQSLHRGNLMELQDLLMANAMHWSLPATPFYLEYPDIPLPVMIGGTPCLHAQTTKVRQPSGLTAHFRWQSNENHRGWQFTHLEDDQGWHVMYLDSTKAKFKESKVSLDECVKDEAREDLLAELTPDEELHGYRYGGATTLHCGVYTTKKGSDEPLRTKLLWMS